MTEAVSPFDTVFDRYPVEQASRLRYLRDLIHETAHTIPQINMLNECFKWGQPSFVIEPQKVGTTVRIDAKDDGVSIYFLCSTNLVERFREIYPEMFCYLGNREIHFKPENSIAEQELRHCIGMALTYHLGKKK